MGENPSDTGEACSKTSLRLSPNQEKLVQKLKETGKPVVVIVFSGRPMELKPILPYCDALIQGWFLGTETGTGIADVLSGDYNPSGRLAMSFPQNVGQIPIYYNNYRTGRPYVGTKDPYVSKYLDCSNEPLYPFGYGLSYSNVEYHDFKAHIENSEIHASSYYLQPLVKRNPGNCTIICKGCVRQCRTPCKRVKRFPNRLHSIHRKAVL